MKALEKAAKDRGEARAEPVATSAESRPELSLALELLAADTPSPRLREEDRPEATARQDTSSGYYRSDTARAAAVMQAGQDAERGVGAYLRDRPVVIFGALAALFAIGFGAYVYLQIFHPGFLLRPTPAPAVPPRIAEAPSPAPPAAAQPIPTAALIQSSAAAQQPASVPLTADSLPEAAPAPPPPKAVAVKPAVTPEPAPPNAIVVKRGDAAPSVNPLLTQAYEALSGGRLERAAQLYSELLRSEPRNTDALLGLAAIALREGRPDDAVRHYRSILESDPRHALAQSGLIGLTGRADPIAAESYLKQLIAREPTAYTYFTLGNLYADRSLWAQAQQAYFQAHHLEPENPDYAYNLAVGLEHISQPRLAVDFYRRAVELASARPQVNFDPARARERIIVLAARVE
jgi:tetratricopeptide (TPR) repeat protein